jgi:hypothetical protein
MYLPLTGYKERDSVEEQLIMNSIGPKIDPQVVQPLDKSARAQQKTEKIGAPSGDKQAQLKEAHDKPESNVVAAHYGTSMNTQDFMILKAQAKDSPYEILDSVISKMKENMEEVGEAIEALSEMVEKTSKSNLGLEILKKTFDAIDKMRGEE